MKKAASLTALTFRTQIRSLCLLLLAIAAAAAPLQAAEPAYQLQVVTDREDALYETGEKARFLIAVTKDGKPVKDGKVSYTVDDFITEYPSKSDFPKGELALNGDSPAVSASSERPGFLRCQVSFTPPQGKTLQATAGAGFSPLKIAPSLPVPDDFDAFWAEQKKKLREMPLEPVLAPVEQGEEGVECFDVEIPCLGGAPVSGYFGFPKNAGPKSLPAILWVHGAGVRSSVLANAVKGAQWDMLSMDINAHGIPNGRPGEFYSNLSAGRLKDYRQAGRESLETVYFRGMFLRLVRALDFLTSRPEWDGEHLIVIGHSQGGGQALAAGGLDPRVTLIASGVPAICDHSGRAAGRVNGWPKLVPTQEDGRPEPQSLQVARYVDGVNFAGRCKAEAIMSVGFIDVTCPPSTCYAAYNCLQGPKQMINRPLMGHAAPADIYEAFYDCVHTHVATAAVAAQ
jgi:cephalosporin-C deacetylase-like acetyl esterase